MSLLIKFVLCYSSSLNVTHNFISSNVSLFKFLLEIYSFKSPKMVLHLLIASLPERIDGSAVVSILGYCRILAKEKATIMMMTHATYEIKCKTICKYLLFLSTQQCYSCSPIIFTTLTLLQIQHSLLGAKTLISNYLS